MYNEQDNQMNNTQEEFEAVYQKWAEETWMHSNPDIYLTNENYLRMIGFGPVAIPWLYEKLKQNEIFLELALESICRVKCDDDKLHKTDWWIKYIEDNNFV